MWLSASPAPLRAISLSVGPSEASGLEKGRFMAHTTDSLSCEAAGFAKSQHHGIMLESLSGLKFCNCVQTTSASDQSQSYEDSYAILWIQLHHKVRWKSDTVSNHLPNIFESICPFPKCFQGWQLRWSCVTNWQVSCQLPKKVVTLNWLKEKTSTYVRW